MSIEVPERIAIMPLRSSILSPGNMFKPKVRHQMMPDDCDYLLILGEHIKGTNTAMVMPVEKQEGMATPHFYARLHHAWITDISVLEEGEHIGKLSYEEMLRIREEVRDLIPDEMYTDYV